MRVGIVTDLGEFKFLQLGRASVLWSRANNKLHHPQQPSRLHARSRRQRQQDNLVPTSRPVERADECRTG